MSIEVVGLCTYPVKSCGALEHTDILVGRTGLLHDREFMLTDVEGQFISQRSEPRLALVKPRVERGHDNSLILSAPDMDDIALALTSRQRARVAVKSLLHGQIVEGLDQTPEVNEWFSRYLDREVFLIGRNPYKPRKIDSNYASAELSSDVGFADAFSILLTSMASLRDLSEKTGIDISMDRFRPNIIVDGDNLEPYEEDGWRRIRTGHQVAEVVRPCKRCVTINVDQSTGEVSSEVLKALVAHRVGIDLTMPQGTKGRRGAYFGQNIQHIFGSASGRPKRIRVGAEMRITTKDSSSNIQVHQ